MKKYVLVAALILIGSILAVYYYFLSYASSSTEHIEGPNPGYLTYYLGFKGGNETMIFLVFTNNPHYGLSNRSYSTRDDIDVNIGDSCFIVNVTVRNDYMEPILNNSPLNGTYYEYVWLTAYLYNQQGRVVAVDVTYPINAYQGGHVFRVEPGETYSVELYLVPESKDIERYEIYVNYVGPLPP